MRMPSFAAARLVLASSLVVACSGSIGPTDEPTENSKDPPGQRPPPAAGACTTNAGLAPLRRLTRAEYDASVRDLLGVTSSVATGFVPDEKLGPFDANVSSPVSEPALEDYLKAAETLARQVVGEPKLLGALVPCDPKTGDAACGRTFIERFGLRAYRRPLAADEVDRIHKVLMTGVAQGDFSVGVRLALQMMLSSPHFLYHMEASGDGALRTLNGYELAARLSYFLWGSVPDPTLLEAARTGELTKAGGLEAQARRLLKDDRARQAIQSFHTQWLGVTKLLNRDEFDNPIGPLAFQEVAKLVDETLWSGDGKLSSLLTTRATYVDATLWKLYGLPGTPPATGFVKAELDGKQRSGILTRAAVLAAHRTPTARGKFVRAELLCQEVPPPPPNVDTALPAADPNQPPRARWEKHVADPTCGGCHKLMDPIGFGFDNYDELGKYRTMDGKWPIDARGEIVGTKSSDGPFTGAVEISERLAKADELGGCVAKEMLIFALGRVVDHQRDKCALDAAEQAFRQAGFDIKSLMLAIAATDGFRLRRVEP